MKLNKLKTLFTLFKITFSIMAPASFIGIRIAGIFGAIVATLGSILSGFIISILIYNFFKKNKDTRHNII